MSKKVYITRQIPESGINKLKEKGFEVDINEEDKVLNREELLTALKSKTYDAVLCLLTDQIDGEIFDACPSAKIFANYAVGYNNINVEDAKKRDVKISNTPGVLTETVAEHTFALLMAISKRIVEADKFTREGKYKGWAPMLFLGTDLLGKTLGVVGLGRIGAQVAKHAANGFGINVVYYDIKRNEEFEKESGASFKENVDDVLKEADFISVHVPLLDSTKHLINEERLSIMKENAYLINTSRGPVVDENALVKILKDKKIKGAALDVFEEEPELAEGLADLENVILTPHVASATEGTRSKMSEMAAENIIAVLEGKEAPNLVE